MVQAGVLPTISEAPDPAPPAGGSPSGKGRLQVVK
jgi:hypothetical protein